MRVYVAIAALVLCGLVGFASSRATAQMEGNQAPITTGEKVILGFEPDRPVYECTVTAIRGDFIGCAADAPRIGVGRPAYERWYNLRLVARIDRPAK